MVGSVRFCGDTAASGIKRQIENENRIGWRNAGLNAVQHMRCRFVFAESFKAA